MTDKKFIGTSYLLDCFGDLLDRLIARILEDKQTEFDFAGTYQTFREIAYHSEQIPLVQLFFAMNSTPLQEFLLLLAIMPHCRRRYEGLFARLNRNTREIYATPQLVLELMEPVMQISFEELYESTLESNLIRRFLLPYDTQVYTTAIASPLRPRKSLLNYVFAMNIPADIVEPYCELYNCKQQLSPVANREELNRAVRFGEHKLKGQEDEFPAAVVISAPKGGGKSFALTYIASQLGRDMISLNCKELLSLPQEEKNEILAETICHCLLWKSLLALENFSEEDIAEDKEGISSLLDILNRVTTWMSMVFITGKKPDEIVVSAAIQSFCISLARFTTREQQAFWELCSKVSNVFPGKDIDFAEISRIYSFTPAEIESIIGSVSAQAVAEGRADFDYAMLKQSIRLWTKPGFSGVAVLLPTIFQREDIMLTKEAGELLQEAVNSAKYTKTIREEWGFDKKLPYGSGISVLFYGPPGTGKTMAAQVLAAQLGMDVYRIDLSQVVDKYIGETQKKLSKIFATAENTNAILFFDEADALFGKRTQVNDSKDKYANMETAYLLQKIEEHTGISILATNIVGNFDNAFKRRINYIINIGMPDADMRLQIWNTVYPIEAPVDRSGFPIYAKKLELSGSNIKNIAVASAFLALAENSTIKRADIVKAIKQEYLKTGGLITDIDIYGDT